VSDFADRTPKGEMRFAGQKVDDGGGQGVGVLEVVLVEPQVGRIGQATGGYSQPGCVAATPAAFGECHGLTER